MVIVFGVLLDVYIGYFVFLMEMIFFIVLRIVVMLVLVVKYLVLCDLCIMVIIGNGV